MLERRYLDTLRTLETDAFKVKKLDYSLNPWRIVATIEDAEVEVWLRQTMPWPLSDELGRLIRVDMIDEPLCFSSKTEAQKKLEEIS